MSDLEAFKKRLRNMLVEFGVEPFTVVGFKDGTDFELTHAGSDMRLRALNDLFKDTYKVNFEDTGEYEATWEDDGEEWKGEE